VKQLSLARNTPQRILKTPPLRGGVFVVLYEYMNDVLFYTYLTLWSVVVSYVLLFAILPLFAKKDKSTSITHSNAHSKAKLEQIKAEQFSKYKGFKSFAKDGVLTVDDIVKGLKR